MTPRKYSCEICYIRSIGKVDYEAHIRGIKHRVEVKRLIQNERSHWKHDRVPQGTHYTCMICEEATYDSASASSYQDHLLAEHPRPTSEAAQMYASNIIPCTLCNVEMSGIVSYQQHLRGRYHSATLQQMLKHQNDNVHDTKWGKPYIPSVKTSPAYRVPLACPYHCPCQPCAADYFPQMRGASTSCCIAEEKLYGHVLSYPCAPVDVRQPSRDEQSSRGAKDFALTGLLRCHFCNTHHRTISHLREHLYSEHDVRLNRKY